MSEPLFTLDLDIYYESHPLPVQVDHGVSSLLLQEEGPAGGNPLYRFVGTWENLRAWLEQNYCGEGTESVDFYLSHAIPCSSRPSSAA